MEEPNIVDLSSLVDRTVLQIVPEMRLEQVHQSLVYMKIPQSGF